MKIVLVSIFFSKDRGGGSGIAYQQAVELQKRGHDVFVFTGTFDSDLGWQEESSIKIYKIKNKNYRYITRSYLCLYNFRVQKKFKKFLKEVNPDVVHFHNLYFHFPFSLMKIAKDYTNKVFFTAHDVMTFFSFKLNHFVTKKYNLQNINNINYKISLKDQIKKGKKSFNPFRNFFIRHYLSYLKKIFSVSDELKKSLEQNKIKNIKVINNGIDISKWSADMEEVERIRANKNLLNKKIILFAGRLSGLKGGEVVIKSMKEVAKDIPSAVLFVLGDKNDYTEKMKNFIKEAGLESNIILNGGVPRTEMKFYYALTDIIIVPSVYLDPFPTINLEAMACGKPVVATIFGGSKDAIKDEENGYVVNPLNIDLISKKIIYLLKNPTKAEGMGKAGLDRVKEEFSSEKWINKILKFYS
ncbi:glycosyltransferase family 4 protein [Candidatus Falkowbacteria bacterium]|jgi:glycosyltransferase involved in cell wall biosynthesis|nr:glycosyltransferase family 4 protein [Candidatus Falkowbacteria bacterium]MBT4433219.1 glycosyltransferase family 4 protein [Candidatus Falkowbacteria bacterium]